MRHEVWFMAGVTVELIWLAGVYPGSLILINIFPDDRQDSSANNLYTA
jgi:hypothetical protein